MPGIAFVRKGQASGSASAATITLSFDASGGDLLCANVGQGASGNVTGATFNGDAMTLVAASKNAPGAGDYGGEQWYIVAPDSGTHDLVVTWDAPPNRQFVGAILLSGVDQTVPLSIGGKANSASATALSKNLTVPDAGAWAVSLLVENGTGAITADGTQTKRNEELGLSFFGCADSTDGPATGSQTQGFSIAAAQAMYLSVAWFKPAVQTARHGFFALAQARRDRSSWRTAKPRRQMVRAESGLWVPDKRLVA